MFKHTTQGVTFHPDCTKHTCWLIMLLHQHLDTSHLSGRWIISAKRSSVTRILTRAENLNETEAFTKCWQKQNQLCFFSCCVSAAVQQTLPLCFVLLNVQFDFIVWRFDPETRKQIFLHPELKLQLLIQSVIYCYLSFFHTCTWKKCKIILRSIKNNQFLNTDGGFHQEHLLSINISTSLLQFSSE